MSPILLLKKQFFTLSWQQSNFTPTCWQILAYRARTLAFSKMASSDGVVLLILRTQRHLAKSAPSFLYCAHLSESPSRPTLQHRHTYRTSRQKWTTVTAVVCEVRVCSWSIVPWVVVSPFVPARGTTPLSTCGDRTRDVRLCFPKHSTVCPANWLPCCYVRVCVYPNMPKTGLCFHIHYRSNSSFTR